MMNRLFVRLSGQPRFALFEADWSSVIPDGSAFSDTGYGDWTGFYDWLRDSSGIIVGLRYWPFEQAAFLIQVTRPDDDLTLDPSRGILIFFGPVSPFDEESSGDQAFEECRVLRKGNDEFALVVGLSDLSVAEMAMIEMNVGANQ